MSVDPKLVRVVAQGPTRLLDAIGAGNVLLMNRGQTTVYAGSDYVSGKSNGVPIAPLGTLVVPTDRAWFAVADLAAGASPQDVYVVPGGTAYSPAPSEIAAQIAASQLAAAIGAAVPVPPSAAAIGAAVPVPPSAAAIGAAVPVPPTAVAIGGAVPQPSAFLAVGTRQVDVPTVTPFSLTNTVTTTGSIDVRGTQSFTLVVTPQGSTTAAALPVIWADVSIDFYADSASTLRVGGYTVGMTQYDGACITDRLLGPYMAISLGVVNPLPASVPSLSATLVLSNRPADKLRIQSSNAESEHTTSARCFNSGILLNGSISCPVANTTYSTDNKNQAAVSRLATGSATLKLGTSSTGAVLVQLSFMNSSGAWDNATNTWNVAAGSNQVFPVVLAAGPYQLVASSAVAGAAVYYCLATNPD